jgi:2-dehydro-3-deoxygluconokinase
MARSLSRNISGRKHRLSKAICSIGECMIELAPDRGSPGLYRRGIAGDSFNTAVYLARLHDGPVSYVTGLGEDAVSDRMAAVMETEGLDCSLIRRVRGKRPGLYMIDVDTEGERQFHYWRNDSAARLMFDGLGPRDIADLLDGFDAIYLSGITLAILDESQRSALFDALTMTGARLFFDPNHRPILWPDPQVARDCYRQMTASCDTVLASLDDNRELFGDSRDLDAASRWLHDGAERVVIHDGREDCLVVAKEGGMTRLAPETSGRPLDTTGCGDAFNAGYMAAILSGKSDGEAVRQAHELAGRVMMVPGAVIPLEDWQGQA